MVNRLDWRAPAHMSCSVHRSRFAVTHCHQRLEKDTCACADLVLLRPGRLSCALLPLSTMASAATVIYRNVIAIVMQVDEPSIGFNPFRRTMLSARSWVRGFEKMSTVQLSWNWEKPGRSLRRIRSSRDCVARAQVHLSRRDPSSNTVLTSHPDGLNEGVRARAPLVCLVAPRCAVAAVRSRLEACVDCS